MRKLILFVLLIASFGATAQNQDVNPYGGIYYNDHSNYRMYGANGLPRTDHANLDTLTNVLKGDLRFDTLNAVVVVYNGTAWVNLPSGGNNLDEAYDKGGAGVGRTITADNGAVKIAGADGLLVTGTFGSGAVPEISGAGTRMFFNPNTASFRVGSALADEWDAANIGDYSFAAGGGTTASANSSTAMGASTIASGISSTAIGSSTVASGNVSFAIGNSTTASGINAVSTGSSTTASGQSSTATGAGTTASGLSSTSRGIATTAESYVEMAIGSYNTDYTPTSTTAWSATDRLLVVGNGANSGALSDAMIILKNGKTTLPSVTGSFTPNVLTTTQRNALTAAAGMMIYNSTTNKHQGYDGTSWNDLY